MSLKNAAKAQARQDGYREPFGYMLEQVRAGCQDAAAVLAARINDALVRAIRRRLPAGDRLQTLLDSKDVEQEALLRVFEAIRNDQVPLDEHIFLQYALRIADNTARMLVREQLAEKRSIERREPLDTEFCEFLSPAPGPDELGTLADCWAQFLATASPASRFVLTLKAHGCAVAEIAEQQSLSTRAVYRILTSEHKRWLQRHGR